MNITWCGTEIVKFQSMKKLLTEQCLKYKQCNVWLQVEQEGLAVASIARDVVQITPPRDHNAR